MSVALNSFLNIVTKFNFIYGVAVMLLVKLDFEQQHYSL